MLLENRPDAPQPRGASPDVVNPCSEQVPCAGRRLLMQGEDVNFMMHGQALDEREEGRYHPEYPAAIDAAGRVEMAGCSLPVLERELEGLALVM